MSPLCRTSIQGPGSNKTTAKTIKLGDSVRFLKGVGPRRAELLERAGLATAEDLLFHLPFRYDDRRRISRVRDLRAGTTVTLIGRVAAVREQQTRRGRRSVLRGTLEDGQGWLELVWFHHGDYWKKRLVGAGMWMAHGRVEAASRGGLQMVHPELESLRTIDRDGKVVIAPGELARVSRILPVYQKPTDVPLNTLREAIAVVVEATASQARSVVPEKVRVGEDLMDIGDALRFVHAPPADADPEALQGSRTTAHRTLIFDELFALQVGMRLQRAQRESQVGRAIARSDDRLRAFYSRLPFEPTAAQHRVIDEIATDLSLARPMNRLVHGDVGSGKTVVAFAAVLQAVASKYQAAVMAPTELLAEQHFQTMRPWAAAEELRMELLTGKLNAAAAAKVREDLAQGRLDLVVGTHALVQDTTSFQRLGLAVVDEQHRFGVLQRAALSGGSIDTLLLSATPIPRTLALTLYGDLDVSFLDELPPGRKPVVTKVIRAGRRPQLWKRMAAVMREGAQCYVVYPQVEESEKTDLAAATEMAAELQRGAFREFRVGLMHGRMKPSEKEGVMRRFKAGDLDVLVATTVIEVGIDVPNASIMVIEHAERFGLAQLHQLRGRVGRGERESFCCLILDPSAGPESQERASVLETSSDGFEIAEADLRLRGPGEYLGTRQAGVPAFRAANLVRDVTVLEEARVQADLWLDADPELGLEESAELRRSLSVRWGERLKLAKIG